MDKRSKILVLGAGAVGAWLLLRKSGTGSSAIAPALSPVPATEPLNLTTEPSTRSTAPASGRTTASAASTILGTTATGASIGATFGPYGALIGGAVGAIGGTLMTVFGSGTPLEPVSKILITQFPYAWPERSNIPQGNSGGAIEASRGIYALDRYGYLWQIGRPLGECGWMDREVIAVDWKVFSMMPKGNALICSPEEIDRMPRPVAADLLRGAFGNNIRFYTGSDPRVHGPWEAGANIPPIPGTPAQWSAIVGDYRPPRITSPGDWA